MSLANIYQRRFGLSFELFPPKTEKGEQALLRQALLRHVDHLNRFHPDYLTCTYGAGGSTQEKTLGIITKVKERLDIPVASHLTCVGSSVDQLRSYLTEARQRGIDHIIALRGDPPKGESEFKATADGFRHANELVELIRSEFSNFGIAVAGYPEKHQEATSFEVDIENLKRKVDALTQIQRISSMCGAALPASLVDQLGERDDDVWQFQVGVEFAVEQVKDLIAHDVCGMHFYVLNKSAATSEVLQHAELDR